jgi:hypothetical protein
MFTREEFGVKSWSYPESTHYPKIYEATESVDSTAMIVVICLIFLTVVLGALIGIIHNTCKEKSLFVCRELDIRVITGGETKRFVGGVIICFYILWVTIVSIGFTVHYLAYNTRIDFTSVTDHSN